MSLIRNLSDRLLFAMGLLLFMQVPQFVDQYTQRLGGYLQGQQQQLSKYQDIADSEFAGDLPQLISEFHSSDKNAVREVGANVADLRQQINEVSGDLQILEQSQFVSKLTHLTLNMNMGVANETLSVFAPGIPLSVEGIVCGLIGGILLSAIFNLLLNILPSRTKRVKPPSRPIEKRVEPKI